MSATVFDEPVKAPVLILSARTDEQPNAVEVTLTPNNYGQFVLSAIGGVGGPDVPVNLVLNGLKLLLPDAPPATPAEPPTVEATGPIPAGVGGQLMYVHSEDGSSSGRKELCFFDNGLWKPVPLGSLGYAPTLASA